jgi:predicted Zn-dependent peptidase
VLSELHFEDVEIIENFIANTNADKTTFASAIEFIRNQINNALLEGNYTVERCSPYSSNLNFGLITLQFLAYDEVLTNSEFQIKGTAEAMEIFKSKTSEQSKTDLQKEIDLLTIKMKALC